MKRITLVLCMLLVLACGSSAFALEGTYKIGVMVPLTGAQAEYGIGQKCAAEMAVEEINAAGGINGKELVIDVVDSGSDIETSVELARKFVEDEEVMFILGDMYSPNCLAMAPICQENGLGMLSPSASNVGVALAGDYCFMIVACQTDEQPMNAKYVLEKYLGCKNVAVLYLNNDWGTNVRDNLVGGIEDYTDMNIVMLEAVNPGEVDFSAILSKLRMSGADGVYLGLQISECAAIINQMAQSGIKDEFKIMISGGAYSNQLLELTNGNANGMVTSQPFFLTDTDEALMGFAAEYKERCGLDIGIMTLCAYDGMKLIADAAIRSGAATRAELRDAVADTKGFIGLGGEITFDQYGANHRKYQIIGIENNQFVLLENADYMADFIPPDIGK